MSRIVRDPSEISNSVLSAFFAYWLRARGARTMPERGDIDPLDIAPNILPHLVLLDVLPDGGNFRYRLAGTGVVERAGMELRGLLATECPADNPDSILREMTLVAEDGLPRYSALGCNGGAEDFKAVERMLTPLGRDGAGVEMLIGAAVFHRCPPNEIVHD
jgi:hypothetical protein